MKHITKKLLACTLCLMLTVSAMTVLAGAVGDYWGFNDYEDFENPGCDELESYPTTVTKLGEDEYSFVSESDIGKTTITMKEMAWGTFNLWTWKLVDKNNTTHSFLPGGTDLEYVYRVAKKQGGGVVWSGGNHGNEALVSLEMYDGETGEKLDFSSRSSYTVNVLHIIEKTELLWCADTDGDGYGFKNKNSDSYTSSDVYAKATRKYTVTGTQVRLNVDYEYLQDTYYGISYTCMFPIAKKYGLYADMFDKDGNLLNTVYTAEVGKADYSGPMNSGNNATRALIYGKNDSEYQFDIHINTPEASLENQKNSFLTAFWDMNTTQNKLYFSKGDNTYSVYKAGDECHTECVWSFKYDENGRTPQEPSVPNNPETEDNLARGKDYDISVTDKNPGSPQYNTSYLADLTDGVASNEFNASNDSWFAFSQYLPNIENGKGSVTVYLGEVCNITKLRAHLFNNAASMGVKAPKSVCAYALIDGKYEKICDFTGISSGDAVAYWITAEADNVKTDTVKFEFTLDGAFMYLNEIEVHGESVGDTSYMLGDVNRNGEIDKYDYILVKRAVMKTIKLNAEQLLAADVNKDGDVEKYDYILIKRHVMKTYTIG